MKSSTKLITILMMLSVIFLTGCNTPAQEPINYNNNNNNNNNNANLGEDDHVKIPISEITSTVKHYSFDVGSAKVNFFAVLGSDGEIRTAFDACDICGGYKGYKQEGIDVVCNNCGKVFKIDDIGKLNTPGGCWPSFLEHKIEGDNILISKPEIAKGSFRFR